MSIANTDQPVWDVVKYFILQNTASCWGMLEFQVSFDSIQVEVKPLWRQRWAFRFLRLISFLFFCPGTWEEFVLNQRGASRKLKRWLISDFNRINCLTVTRAGWYQTISVIITICFSSKATEQLSLDCEQDYAKTTCCISTKLAGRMLDGSGRNPSNFGADLETFFNRTLRFSTFSLFLPGIN